MCNKIICSVHLHFVTVNTKANVKFHVDSADWLTERVKERLKQLVCVCDRKII